MTEKGAMMNTRAIYVSNSEEKIEKFSNSQSKNTKIEDFFSMSGKKRERDADGTDINNSIRKENQMEVINLIDDINSSNPSNKSNNSFNQENLNTSVIVKKKKIKSKKSQTKSNIQASVDSQNADIEQIRERKNRNSCSICREVGDLILCDNCPKSFHFNCLKLKKNEIPEGNWYCINCVPIVERRSKKEVNPEEMRKKKNEKRRLYRLKKKEEQKKLKTGAIHINHSLHMANKLKNSLQKNLNLKGNFPLIPVISEEIQNKIIEESQKLHSSLIVKLKGTSVFSNGVSKMSTSSIDNNFLITSFLKDNNKNQSISNSISDQSLQKKANKMIESIDLTGDDAYTFNQVPRNKIPTEEEAKKILASITKNGIIDILALNSLAASNPILYAKVNNLYISSLNSTLPKSASQIKKLNIKYPIDDDELYANPEMHNLNNDFLNKPKGKPSTIPNEYFSKILKISDFINTFRHKLEISEFRPDDLYNALSYYKDEEIQLINEVHIAIILLIIGNLKQIEYEKLFEDRENDLILLKIATDNNSIREILKKTWPEIIRLIINSEYYRLMVTEDIKDSSRRLKLVNTRNYNLLPIDEKLTLLEYLLNTAMDSELIKQTIEEDIKLRIELSREKNDIESELKQNENRKREIERQEKYTSARQKVESLNKKLQNLVEDNPQLSRVEMTKLRRESEQERDKFKSIIKEADEIENVKNKINTRLEKLSNEIYQIPSINKKLMGRDGLKNEYYFYPWISNKIYVKFCLSNDSRGKKFEWREITTEDEVNELISRLSEKGIKEGDLLNKIKKIYPKRLKVKPSTSNSEKEADDDTNNTRKDTPDKNEMVVDLDNEEENNSLKTALEWRNKMLDRPSKGNKSNIMNKNSNLDLDSNNYFDDVIKSLTNLEEKISDYLFKDEKEWESFDIRQGWKAWLGYIKKIPEYAKSLLLFNEKFKSPYKINEVKSKIVNDDDFDYGHASIINSDGSLDIYKTNPNRVIAPKAKLWSRDFEIYEEYFVEYVNNILSNSSLILGIYMFLGVLNDLIRRRDYYKKKENGLGINEETESYSESVIGKNNRSENMNSLSNTNNSRKNKFDFNDYYNDDLDYKEFAIDIFNEDIGRRSKRLQSSKNNSNINNFSDNIYQNVNINKKRIDWNDDCYVCGDDGNLLCCEDCPNVAHLFCAGLKKEPETWRCENCTYRLVNKRVTRSSNIK